MLLVPTQDKSKSCMYNLGPLFGAQSIIRVGDGLERQMVSLVISDWAFPAVRIAVLEFCLVHLEP
jgi:hypothetical protein